MAIQIKAGDTAPTVQATLLDVASQPVDLDGATARFILAGAAAPHTVAVDAPATVVQVGSANRGVVAYAWEPGDTDTPGAYVAEFEITYASGAVQTFPTQDFIPATIYDDLGGTV